MNISKIIQAGGCLSVFIILLSCWLSPFSQRNDNNYPENTEYSSSFHNNQILRSDGVLILYAEMNAAPIAGVKPESGGKTIVNIKLKPTDFKIDIFENRYSMTFALLPPGDFIMGSPADEEYRFRNEIEHKVTLSRGFYMQTKEVTQGQWMEIMGYNPSFNETCGPNCPVENVSWDEVQLFIKKLRKLDGGRLYRLPTEAEWEYACRAGSNTAYSCGDDDELFSYYAWYSGNSGFKTHPMGEKEPNAWWLYDMHGNAREWCSDLYGGYPDGSVIDPQGIGECGGRVLRGGSYSYPGALCRSAYRGASSPTARNRCNGFRLVLPRGQY